MARDTRRNTADSVTIAMQIPALQVLLEDCAFEHARDVTPRAKVIDSDRPVGAVMERTCRLKPIDPPARP